LLNIKCSQLSKPKAKGDSGKEPNLGRNQTQSGGKFSSGQRTNSIWLWFRSQNVQNMYPVPSPSNVTQ